MACRAGEEDKTRFRSQRFYIVDDKHYFSTREGTEIGPFGSRKDAEDGLARYIKYATGENANIRLAETAAMQGEWASTQFE